jgi:hypothetical protein
MSISPINGGTIIQFPRAHNIPMTLSQPGMQLNPAAAAVAHAAAAQQRISVADTTIAKRNATNAQKRANHNAIERARRECLNSKFQELAQSIPALAQVRRPSKSVIVQKSLEYIHKSKLRAEARDRELRTIKNENMSLREEVDRLRRTLGLSPLPERPPTQSPEPDDTLDAPDTPSTSSTSKETTSTTPSATTTSSSRLTDRKRSPSTHDDEDNEDDEEDERTVSRQSMQPHTPTANMFAPNAMLGEQSRPAMDPATAAAVAQMPTFLDYMHTDMSGTLSPASTGFVSPLAFPAVAPGVHPVLDIYNTPLSLATTAAAMAAAAQVVSPLPPHQPMFLPSPSDDVFNMNELMMAGCIDPSSASVAAAAAAVTGGIVSAEHTVEPQQLQTPPQH